MENTEEQNIDTLPDHYLILPKALGVSTNELLK